MNTITEKQYRSLKQKIYLTLLDHPDMGMGEMGECEDEAARIIDEWTKENNIEIVPMGDAIVELFVSDQEQLTEQAESICLLTGDDADAMEQQGIDCSDEGSCLKYAKEVKGAAIPDDYLFVRID